MSLVPILVYTLTPNTYYFLVTGFLIGIGVNVLLFFFVPESIRFYLVHKKDDKAIAICQSLAKSTGKQNLIDKYQYVKLDDGAEEDEEQKPISELLRYFVSTKGRLIEIIIVSLIWFTNVFQNYGLAFEMNKLGG